MRAAQATLLCLALIPQIGISRPPVEVRGRVVLPDGRGAGGAEVSAVTDCQQYRLVNDAIADSDGYYTIRVERPNGCSGTQFFASDRSHFWLKTGTEVFYRRPNGTVPTLDLGGGPPTVPLVIPLTLRGGVVSVQVRDSSSGRSVYAHLMIELSGDEEAKFGSMQIATGEDGAPDTLFLPAGQYVARIVLIGLDNRLRAVVSSPTFTFTVVGASSTKSAVEVDVRKLSLGKDARPTNVKALGQLSNTTLSDPRIRTSVSKISYLYFSHRFSIL